MKILILLNFVISMMSYSQQLNSQDKQKLEFIKKCSENYVGKELKILLQDLPSIKMIRISPDNPLLGVHTFIIGFMDNATFSRTIDSKKKDRITLYVKGNNPYIRLDVLTKEDLTTNEATEKYGDLIITSIFH